MGISAADAQDLATDLLLALIAQPDDLTRFLEAGGLDPSDLRGIADSPRIAVFLLDFVTEDDARLLAFAAALGRRPQDIMAARTALAGPGSHGWSVD